MPEMTPKHLRIWAEDMQGDIYSFGPDDLRDGASAWEADHQARHMEAAKFLSQIAAWKASCEDAEKREVDLRKRIDELEEAGRYDDAQEIVFEGRRVYAVSLEFVDIHRAALARKEKP